MPAFEGKDGMPFWQDLMTTNVLKSTHFYSNVFGWEIVDGTARKDGLPVAGLVSGKADGWVTSFMGGGEVEKLGGRVLSADGELTLCEDPSGGLFGLMDPEERFVAAGEPGVPVWYELVTTDQATIDFYGDLFDWEIREEDGYFLAFEDGAPFLGMYVDEAASWVSYFGVEDLEAACKAVEAHGGTVLVGPGQGAFGPMAGIADPNGAQCFIVEVEAPTFEEISEADSVL